MYKYVVYVKCSAC